MRGASRHDQEENDLPIPPANPFHIWIDITSRLDAARAVAGCAVEAAYLAEDRAAPALRALVEHAACLCGAVDDLIELARHDVARLEPYLRALAEAG